MSRILVDQIRSNSASADALTLDGSGNLTIPGNLTCSGNAALSGTATGFGGGKVLQVVQGTQATNYTQQSSTYADLNLSATLTPQTNSKVLAFLDIHVRKTGHNYHGGFGVKLVRTPSGGSGTAVFTSQSSHEIYDFHISEGAEVFDTDRFPWNILDSSPGGNGSTAITYKVQVATYTSSGGATMSFHHSATSALTLIEVGA